MTGCHYLGVTVTSVTPSAARGREDRDRGTEAGLSSNKTLDPQVEIMENLYDTTLIPEAVINHARWSCLICYLIS